MQKEHKLKKPKIQHTTKHHSFENKHYIMESACVQIELCDKLPDGNP